MSSSIKFVLFVAPNLCGVRFLTQYEVCDLSISNPALSGGRSVVPFGVSASRACLDLVN